MACRHLLVAPSRTQGQLLVHLPRSVLPVDDRSQHLDQYSIRVASPRQFGHKSRAFQHHDVRVKLLQYRLGFRTEWNAPEYLFRLERLRDGSEVPPSLQRVKR